MQPSFSQKEKVNKKEKKKQRKYKQAAYEEVVEKVPPWESRVTRSQLQEKKKEKKRVDTMSLLLTISTPLITIYIITYIWLLHLTHYGVCFHL